MRQLSSLDANFLHVESVTTTGHVGSVLVLDPVGVPGGALNLDDVRDVLEPRLHLVPTFRQRLVTVPLSLGLPYWVDDPDFDIEFHLREVALPQPGDDQQLGEQIARIHARPLDRARPLWEMYLIHGVEGGRQAVYAKMHHAAIDGVTGVEVLGSILDVTAAPRVEPPPDEFWEPGRVPGSVDLLARGIVSTVKQPLDILRTLPSALPHLGDLPGADLVPGVRIVSNLADSAIRSAAAGALTRGRERRTVHAPHTPLNATITGHRRFAFGALPLEEVKTVKNAFAMTVNDVVMALCTTVLRRWMLDHDGLPDGPIVAGVPVSVRPDEVAAETANPVSVMLAELPTQIRDPAERLAAVRAAMAVAKEQFDAVPAGILHDVSATVPTALSGLAARAAFRTVSSGSPPLNLFISNVPGPQQPLYVAGATVQGIYPASAITDFTGALNITLFSYDGQLDFGLIACREIVPDVWDLIGHLREALDELLELAQSSDSSD